MKSPSEIARSLGKHIFDWGCKSEGMFVEKYRIEREKAIKQLEQVLTTERQRQERLVEALEKIANFPCQLEDINTDCFKSSNGKFKCYSCTAKQALREVK